MTTKQSNWAIVDISALHDEVTGSCILCTINFKEKCNGKSCIKFIVDCGLFQEEKYDKLNEQIPFDEREIDFALVTHAHIDHIGRLPLLVKNGFNGTIYSTKATRSIMRPALKNCCEIKMNEALAQRKVPIYDMGDVEHTLSLVSACNFKVPIEITPNIKATFFKNGHLVGAALILVQISVPYCEDINILFTGDYNNKNLFFDVPELPQYVLDLPLYILQESTYGKTLSTEIKSCFTSNIIEAANKRKSIVIPTFALARTQEVLYMLKTLKATKAIHVNYPIYLDGPLPQTYTRMWLTSNLGINEDMKDFLPENLQYITAENRRTILENFRMPKIIVTSSGMGSNGPAQMHIPAVLPYKKGLIHFTGYATEGTLARRLKESANETTIDIAGQTIKKEAMVLHTQEFSSHAKSDEMIEFLKSFNNIKMIILNHGASDTKKAFMKSIEEQVSVKDVVILDRTVSYRIDSNGLVKTRRFSS